MSVAGTFGEFLLYCIIIYVCFKDIVNDFLDE